MAGEDSTLQTLQARERETTQATMFNPGYFISCCSIGHQNCSSPSSSGEEAHEPQPPGADPAPQQQRLPRSLVLAVGATQNTAPQPLVMLHRPWLKHCSTSEKHQPEYRIIGHIELHDLLNCTGQDIFPKLNKNSHFINLCMCSTSLLTQQWARSHILIWESRDSQKQGCY